MYNYEKHLIAYHLLEKINEENGNCYGTRTLIHLLITIKPDNVERDLESNNAGQIRIEHSARASKSTYRLDCLNDLNLSYNKDDDQFSVSYELNRKNGNPIQREISFDIPEFLETQENLIIRGFNTSPLERDTLKTLLRRVSDNGNEVNENNIDDKFYALHRLLKAISTDNSLVQDISRDQEPSYGDRFLQTILGAALFYCPTSVKHWDGKISLDAIQNKVKYNINWTKDHINPRRRGAIQLMTRFNEGQMNVEHLHNLYNSELAKFTYLTSDENRRLTNYYLEYGNREDALTANGIKMIPANENIRFRNNADLNRFIEHLRTVHNNREPFTLDYVEEQLREFRLQ